MPEWIHNRAEHLLAKNPSMSKSTAFAVATQQSHALGKSPKGYGTAKGRRVARRKFDTPKDDVKRANPGGLDSPKLASMGRALSKAAAQRYMKALESGEATLPELHQGLARQNPRAAGLLQENLALLLPTSPYETTVSGAGREAVNLSDPYLLEDLRAGARPAGRFSMSGRGAAPPAEAFGGALRRFLRSHMRPVAKIAGVDLLPGGKADGKTDKDFDKEQLAKGERVEQEHSKGNRALAREIARDHLEEIPDYYTRLKRMEDEAPKRKESSMRIALYKEAFQVSQWSGELGPYVGGPYPSGVPPFRQPQVVPEKLAGPPGEPGKRKQSASNVQLLARLLVAKRRAEQGKGPWDFAAVDPSYSLPGLAKHGQAWQAMAKAAAALTPAGRLAVSQRRFTSPLMSTQGPSIASIARPHRQGLGAGYGHALPEALKA